MDEKRTRAPSLGLNATPDLLESFVRIPGLLRRWEISQVIQPGTDFHIEDGGATDDGTRLFVVYQQRANPTADADVGIPVGLTFEGELVTLRARLLPISAGEPLMAVLVLDESQREAATLGRVREHLAQSLCQSGNASRTGVAAPVAGEPP